MTDRDKPNLPPPAKPMLTERLTPEEIEALRQDAKETSDFARNAFGHLRPKADPCGKFPQGDPPVTYREVPAKP